MFKFLRRLLPALFSAALATSMWTPAFAGGPARLPPPTAEQSGSYSDLTDRVILRFRDAAITEVRGPQEVQRLAGRLGESVRHLRSMSGRNHVLKLARLYTKAEAEALVRRLASDPAVEFAEPDLRMVPLLTPNDSSYSQQWDLYESAGGINAPAAWDRTTGSSAITIAVLDTGLLPHAELAGRTVAGYDFITDVAMANDGDGRDPNPSDPGDWGCNGNNSSWHGTHVAGTIGAAANNAQGIAGINWVSKIQPVRVLGRCGGYSSDIIDAMRWAAGIPVAGAPNNATPARVMNLSFGGSGACGTSYQNAINDVIARGAVVVVAAGNSGVDASNASPANCDGVIAVGATTRSGARASYSNFGSLVAISAPGSSILSTLNTGTTVPAADTYAFYSGTSMATPHVVGVVSLMLSMNPALTPAQIKTMVQSSARAFPTGTGADCTTTVCGAGIVDAAAALAAVAPVTPPPVTMRTNWALNSNGSTWSASSTYNSGYPAASAGDGDRKGTGWGRSGGWNDATPGVYPDALEVNFGTPRTVAEIDVYTVQDNYANPVEPTDAMTFSLYGITDFEVQYWDGASWVTVSGGSVTGNNRVARRFSFTPVTTSGVRVLITGALASYSRITELEAWSASQTVAAPTVNFAAAANGGTATASSTYSSSYPVSAVIDGDRIGAWGSGGGWNDATYGTWPDWLQVSFSGSRSISEIDVFTLQDNFSAPQIPTASMAFSQYGITAFDIQYWTGAAWATVPGGSITGNSRVWTKVTFPVVTTNAIRVVVYSSLASYSRITEIEAWGTP